MTEPTAPESLFGESLAVPADFRPRKRADVLELDMGDGFVLYNKESDLVHHLNPTAAIVWNICDGEATVEQLAREIAEEYRADPDRIHREVAHLVAELNAIGLVDDARVVASGQA